MTKKTASDKPSASSMPAVSPSAAEKSLDPKTAGTGKRTAKFKTAQEAASSIANSGFPIVAIGASAGGLEAMDEFFKNMPPDSGIGFVVVTHQHAGHISLLPELLGKRTAMPVVEATDGVRVEPSHVYISPPGAHIAMMDNTLQFMQPLEPEDIRLPIDYFFRSLASDKQEQAICIVLSGTGTDGTLGLREIKGAGGMTMAQELKSAKYPGMPSSAMMTNLVDFVLPPAQMPAQLIRYVQGFPPSPLTQKKEGMVQPPLPLEKIFLLLRAKTGHDFAGYKVNTMRRRIERRMNVHQVKDADRYLRYLQENPHELDILFKELLINVTSFFRDAAAFEALAQVLEKKLLAEISDEAFVFRAWVAGCGSGEEAYSIAIVLHECMERIKRHRNVQIFASDLDGEAINIARLGFYPEGIAVDVSKERLLRYFQREDNGYRIANEIRQMVVFAPQNILHDPPFTKLDLLSCRNVLIYFNSDLQKRLLPIFHYALKSGGLLFLGPSETISSATELFEAVDKRWKIFRRCEKLNVQTLLDLSPRLVKSEPAMIAAPHQESIATIQVSSLIERALLKKYAPASVIVNDRGDIMYIHGRTGYYLEPASGQAGMNVLDMAREGLRLELATALRQAVTKSIDIQHPNVRVKTNGDYTVIDLTVARIAEPEPIRGLFIVSFRPVGDDNDEKSIKAARPMRKAEQTRIKELERELQYTKETLQTTVEELETSNEELKSTNEELQSTNEELQSTNEELETSKEEMQSLNEELITVNAELQSKVEDLSQTNDDMQNLLNSTEIATLFLDDKLHIKRFTKQAKKLVHLIDNDVGRPIADLVNELQYNSLMTDAEAVLQTLVFKEREVQTTGGDWRLMRILPYRTVDNLIDGLVVTFIDINKLKQVEQAYAEERRRLEQLTGYATTVLYSSSPMPDYHPIFVCRNVVDLTGFEPEEILEQPNLWMDHIHRDDKDAVNTQLQSLAKSERQILAYRFARKDGIYVHLRDHAMLVRDANGEAIEIVGAIIETTAE
ncbi:MAG: CheR family methyltransferase [Gammaproteobacteria bacterium]